MSSYLNYIIVVVNVRYNSMLLLYDYLALKYSHIPIYYILVKHR
jgi:hypothetical protein